VGGYTNYKGPIPPADKAAWEAWWKDNNRDIEVSSRVETAPEYVREQLADAREALKSRFDKRVAKSKLEEKRRQKAKAKAKAKPKPKPKPKKEPEKKKPEPRKKPAPKDDKDKTKDAEEAKKK